MQKHESCLCNIAITFPIVSASLDQVGGPCLQNPASRPISEFVNVCTKGPLLPRSTGAENPLANAVLSFRCFERSRRVQEHAERSSKTLPSAVHLFLILCHWYGPPSYGAFSGYCHEVAPPAVRSTRRRRKDVHAFTATDALVVARATRL